LKDNLSDELKIDKKNGLKYYYFFVNDLFLTHIFNHS